VKYAFFIGCLTPAMASQYEASTRKVAEKLGIELVDVKDFACCGFPIKSVNHESALLLAARNLSARADCARHENITIHTLSEVTGVEGQTGDFIVRLRTYARFVKEKECTNCGDCAAKCPVKVPDEFDMGLRKRGAIYPYYLQWVPAVMTIDRDNCLYLKRGVCRICEMCSRNVIDFEQEDTDVTLHVVAIIVATGRARVSCASFFQRF
jgi:heterodisulfide reductase subunit A-like polyferredoxin